MSLNVCQNYKQAWLWSVLKIYDDDDDDNLRRTVAYYFLFDFRSRIAATLLGKLSVIGGKKGQCNVILFWIILDWSCWSLVITLDGKLTAWNEQRDMICWKAFRDGVDKVSAFFPVKLNHDKNKERSIYIFITIVVCSAHQLL